MGHPEEQEWQLALHKAKHSVRHQQKIPLSKRQEDLVLDIKEAKQMMSEAIQEKDSSEIRIILERLIVLRAMQTALALEAWNTKYGKPTRTMIGLESRRYMEDCKKLINSVEHSLS